MSVDDRCIERPVHRDPVAGTPIELSIHDDLAAVEATWRQFEAVADATVFQSFDWLSTWFRHVGRLQRVTPAIVIGRRAGTSELLFLIPLAIRPGMVRELTFLGSGLCDYNAPLLAPNFAGTVSDDDFRRTWRAIRRSLQAHPRHRHDIVRLLKMPEVVGNQRNPFLALDVGLNPSGAHLTDLLPSWNDFYTAKRSSTSRRRDRTKGKRLAEFGEVRLVTPQARDEIAQTLDQLFSQKAKLFARMGVADVFAQPGYREFFFDLAIGPNAGSLAHVSRLDIGSSAAAVNYGLLFHDTYYHVIASYDDGPAAKFGPGAAHLRELLRHAIERQCRCFDFTIGDERYKLEWSDRALKLYDHVAAATVRGRPAATIILARRRVTRTIKQNPRLWAMFSRLRAALGKGKGAAAGDEGDGMQVRSPTAQQDSKQSGKSPSNTQDDPSIPRR